MNNPSPGGLLRKFLSFSIGPWSAAAISFVTTPIITWLIAPAEFGKSAMFIVAHNILLLSSLLGMDQSYIRFFNDATLNDKRALLKRSIGLSLSIGGAIALIVVLFSKQVSFFLFEDSGSQFAVILALSVVFGILYRYSLIVLRMQQRGLAFSIFSFCSAAINAVLVIVFSYVLGRTFLTLILAFTLSVVCVAISSIIFQHAFFFGKSTRAKNLSLKKMLHYGLPLAPAALVAWAFMSMDRLALRAWSNYDALGMYVAAFKIAAALELFRVSYTTFWTPVALEQYTKNPGNYRFFEKMFQVLCASTFLLAICIMATKDLIVYLFDEQYRDAAMIMPFLLLIPAMHTLSEATVVGINFKKKTSWHFWIIVFAAGINYAGNYLLVPQLGAKGAAISTAFAYVVFFTARTFISKRLFPVPYHLLKTYIMILLISGFALLSTFVNFSWSHVAIGAAIMVCCLFFYKESYKEVLLVIKEGSWLRLKQ
ncbi:MAG: polysaccharide biosynthesis protein [Proteobacteria bacterium]|nr:polysaccharide biosynthesis protein [Pseudomonadota bacterium]